MLFDQLQSRMKLFFLGPVLTIYGSLSWGSQCGDLNYAIELMIRTTCAEANEDSCAILNTSRLFRKDPGEFLFFASMEKLTATKLNSMARSQLDIEGMHKLIADYNHARHSHDTMKWFTNGTEQTPGNFARMAAASKAKGADGTIDPDLLKSRITEMGAGSKEYYEREILPIRRAIYKKLGFEAEGDGFTRVREVEDFIRAWRRARGEAPQGKKSFNPDKNPGVKAAWKALFNNRLTSKMMPLPRIKGASGVGQNLAFGAVEALDRGPVKTMDVARAACPKNSFSDYDQLPNALKELFEKDGCQLVIPSENLMTVFNDFAQELTPQSPVCTLLEKQRERLRGANVGDIYRDIEVPQRPDAGDNSVF